MKAIKNAGMAAYDLTAGCEKDHRNASFGLRFVHHGGDDRGGFGAVAFPDAKRVTKADSGLRKSIEI
jgi:hypothetical protein